MLATRRVLSNVLSKDAVMHLVACLLLRDASPAPCGSTLPLFPALASSWPVFDLAPPPEPAADVDCAGLPHPSLDWDHIWGAMQAFAEAPVVRWNPSLLHGDDIFGDATDAASMVRAAASTDESGATKTQRARKKKISW